MTAVKLRPRNRTAGIWTAFVALLALLGIRRAVQAAESRRGHIARARLAAAEPTTYAKQATSVTSPSVGLLGANLETAATTAAADRPEGSPVRGGSRLRGGRFGRSSRRLPVAASLVAVALAVAAGVVFLAPSASAGPSGTADFTFAPTAPAAGQAVSFDGSGSTCTATPCTYSWSDAADGSSLGTGAKSSYTFKDAGTKNVTLKVTDAAGQAATVEHDVSVAAKPAPGVPTAAFTFAPAAPTTGQAVNFDGSGSTCSATPCTYAWTDAADGSSLGTGVKSSYTFKGVGTKQVTLKVTDATSHTATVEHDVKVGAAATPSAPTAAFTFTPTAPTAGQAVNFDGSGSTCAATPCTYAWTDAADGSSLGTGVKSSFTFQGAGTKQVTLKVTDATSRTASVEHDVNVGSGTTTTPPPSGGGGTGTGSKLTWAPPACGDASHSCVTLNLNNTGSHQSFSLSSSNDYRVNMPSVPLVGGLSFSGGHNIIIIGGQINMTPGCGAGSSSSCQGIHFDKNTSGEVFIEGVYIHGTDPSRATGDGMDMYGEPSPNNTNYTIQNVREDNLIGCEISGAHTDVIQSAGVPDAKFHIDHLTGTSNCQGLQIDPDLAWSLYGKNAAEYIIKNVNMKSLSSSGNDYFFWLTGDDNGCGSSPITLTNVYAQEPGSNTLSVGGAWPDTDQPSACHSVYSNGQLSFPSSPQIHGTISNGLPPGGDEVPVGLAGTNYVSPGYN
jgi:hypothetical protein